MGAEDCCIWVLNAVVTMEHRGGTALPVVGPQSSGSPIMVDPLLPARVSRRSGTQSLLVDTNLASNRSKNDAWNLVVLVFCMTAGCLSIWFAGYHMGAPDSPKPPIVPMDAVFDAAVAVAEAGGMPDVTHTVWRRHEADEVRKSRSATMAANKAALAAMSSAQEAQAEVQKLKEELKEERKLRLESTQRELRALKEASICENSARTKAQAQTQAQVGATGATGHKDKVHHLSLRDKARLARAEQKIAERGRARIIEIRRAEHNAAQVQRKLHGV